LQAKLLNVLERRMVRRIGSTKERAVPARFIAATNRDLHEMSLTGSFRQDLYYRLNVINIVMPPLRERASDILMLAKYFAAQTSRRYGLATPVFSTDAIAMINSYNWPGNVRELRHQISRAMLLSHQGQIAAIDLALPINRALQTTGLQAVNAIINSEATLDEVERSMLLKVMSESDNNVSRAARKLGITRMTMRYRLDKHQLNLKVVD
jgi:two-component system, NtrC family, response regulator AtoC